jgi:metal-dependent amidase/aminoacylase/carboxypeptidase family protein
MESAVDDMAAQMVTLRRHLHAHPEPSGEELQN